MQSGPPYRQEHDPIDQSLWHQVPVTEPTALFNNQISPQSKYHQDHLGAGIVSKDPEYSGILQTPDPAVTLKEIDCKSQM